MARSSSDDSGARSAGRGERTATGSTPEAEAPRRRLAPIEIDDDTAARRVEPAERDGAGAREGVEPADRDDAFATEDGSSEHPEIDWIAAERSPEFGELIRKRRSFVLPATAFFFVWYFGFIILAGYAPGFMGTRLVGGLTVGYVFALTQFVMVWVLGALYLKRADRDFDPLARRAAETALEAGRGRMPGNRGGVAR